MKPLNNIILITLSLISTKLYAWVPCQPICDYCSATIFKAQSLIMEAKINEAGSKLSSISNTSETLDSTQKNSSDKIVTRFSDTKDKIQNLVLGSFPFESIQNNISTSYTNLLQVFSLTSDAYQESKEALQIAKQNNYNQAANTAFLMLDESLRHYNNNHQTLSKSSNKFAFEALETAMYGQSKINQKIATNLNKTVPFNGVNLLQKNFLETEAKELSKKIFLGGFSINEAQGGVDQKKYQALIILHKLSGKTISTLPRKLATTFNSRTFFSDIAAKRSSIKLDNYEGHNSVSLIGEMLITKQRSLRFQQDSFLNSYIKSTSILERLISNQN